MAQTSPGTPKRLQRRDEMSPSHTGTVQREEDPPRGAGRESSGPRSRRREQGETYEVSGLCD